MANVWGKSIELNQLPEGARVVQYGHRSGAEAHERCPRAYFYQYEYLGGGMNISPTPIYLKVGSAVHLGLAALLLEEGIDSAVQQALDYLKGGRAFQLLQYDQQVEQEVLVHGLLYAFFVYAYPSLISNFEVLTVETGAVEYVRVNEDEWAACSSCGGSGFSVKRGHPCGHCGGQGQAVVNQPEYLAIQSRPDAILRNRRTGEVAGWSWKTIDDPTDMRRSQLHNDLQGFMEMYYGERILAQLAGANVTTEELEDYVSSQIAGFIASKRDSTSVTPTDFATFMASVAEQTKEKAIASRNIPTSIDYIQTVFLVKGKRKKLEENAFPSLSADSYSSDTDDDEFGGYQPNRIYRQMSHLCYRYRNANPEVLSTSELYKTGPNKGKPKPIDTHNPNLVEESWAYKFYKPDNQTASGLSTKWLTSPIQPDQIRDWIDRLNVGAVYPSTMNDERNPHPLAKIIQFEQPLYRNVDKAANHVAQQKRRYVQIANSVQRMNSVIDDYKMSAEAGQDVSSVLLNILNEEFPQYLINCRTPWRCPSHDFCHTPRESEIDFASVPDGFETRESHHEFERKWREENGAQTDGTNS